VADPPLEWRADPGPLRLRAATSADQVRALGESHGLAPAGLAPALLDPAARLLVDDRGNFGLLRREWADDGTAEALLVRAAGVRIDQPAVLAAAAGWGCGHVRDPWRDKVLTVPAPPYDAPLPERFRHLAALAATRVEVAVALARDGREQAKDDGSPSHAADRAAHAAAAEVLGSLGLCVLSEETPDRPVADDEPWIVLDPLDGTGNFSAGLPPWAFSAALVSGGRPIAGLVADLSSGRRWSAVDGEGAERDGVPVGPRPGSTVVMPSAPSGGSIPVPPTAARVRITGCTAVELCLVADGSAGAWHDLDRSGSHVHDVAGGLAVLLAAGGVALTPDGEPLVLRPDTGELIRFVAAADPEAARRLLDAARPG
jgi:3'(2'), 5'-bisphosphate nucleotidase